MGATTTREKGGYFNTKNNCSRGSTVRREEEDVAHLNIAVTVIVPTSMRFAPR